MIDPTPHKHRVLIIAWANGAKIQFYDESEGCWEDVDIGNPMWENDTLYRVKPEEQVLYFQPEFLRTEFIRYGRTKRYPDDSLRITVSEGKLTSVELL